MTAGVEIENGSCDPDHALLGVVGHPKARTRVPGLSHGVVCVILHLAVLVQYRRVTDGQMDRRKDT